MTAAMNVIISTIDHLFDARLYLPATGESTKFRAGQRENKEIIVVTGRIGPFIELLAHNEQSSQVSFVSLTTNRIRFGLNTNRFP